MRRRIAQLFMIGFSGAEASEELLPLIESDGFTSFILFKRNAEDKESLSSMIAEARDAGERLGLPRLLFAADEEGGLISPLGDLAGRLPSAMGLTAGTSEERARRAAAAVGYCLRELGVDLVLAPVLDVNDEPRNPVIGTRSFGDDSRLVALMGAAVIEGYHSARLACCVKHFPGHGSTAEDSHKSLPVVKIDEDEIGLKQLPPFKAAFVRGAEAVMTAHVAYPGIDGHARRPGTLSPEIITGLLRTKMKFGGAVISDSLEMMGLTAYKSPPEVCVDALKAGVDLFICVSPALAKECVAALSAALERGELGEETIERALAYIGRLKSASRGGVPKILETAFPKMATDRDTVLSECYTASITLLDCEPRKLKETLAAAESGVLLVPKGLPGYEAADTAFVERTLADLGVGRRWRVVSYPHDPGDQEISATMAAVKSCDCAVFCGLSRGIVPKGQRRLREDLVSGGKLSAVAALLDPYEVISGLPDGLPRIATYGYWPECLATLLDLLFGLGGAPGVMPVARVASG
jgi:beta-N-acetylhexosaminidase